MQDILITLIGIFLAVILLFIYPIMNIANKNDELSETAIQLIANDFVNDVARDGKITLNDYSNLITRINATGNVFNVQIEVKILDDNPSRETSTKSSILNAEAKYYSIYTNEIVKKLEEKGEYLLKSNDYIIVSIENENITLGTQLRSFIYKIMGQDTKVIVTTASAVVL